MCISFWTLRDRTVAQNFFWTQRAQSRSLDRLFYQIHQILLALFGSQKISAPAGPYVCVRKDPTDGFNQFSSGFPATAFTANDSFFCTLSTLQQCSHIHLGLTDYMGFSSSASSCCCCRTNSPFDEKTCGQIVLTSAANKIYNNILSSISIH